MSVEGEVEGPVLSEVEGSEVEGPVLSEVEGPVLSEVEGSEVEGPALSEVEGPALSEVEGSELGLRPVFHSKEDRSDVHLFITVLAYQIVQVLRTQWKEAGIHDSWNGLRQIPRSTAPHHCQHATP